MPLSWNEIRSRAIAFSREWAEESREHAEAKSFWDGFFDVFGLTRRHVASYEAPVKQLGGTYGFIDLLMKGTLIAEHKSRGKDLGRAHSQAMDYIQSLQREGRGDEAPQFVVVSDFARIALHDLEEDTTHEFPLSELHKNVQHFAFIPGYKTHKLRAEDPVNLKAVQIMGDLHDAVEADGYCLVPAETAWMAKHRRGVQGAATSFKTVLDSARCTVLKTWHANAVRRWQLPPSSPSGRREGRRGEVVA
jgi:hypothetical protein